MSYLGRGVASINNKQLVAGAGTYVADLKLDRMLHAAIVRSPYAAARIVSIDTKPAEAVPGVVSVVTGQEVRAETNPIEVNGVGTGTDAKEIGDLYALCVDRVRFVGEAVAAVVATDPYTAKRAAALVDVEYEERTPVVDAEAALAPDSPRVEEEWDDNIVFETQFVAGDVDAAFSDADGVLEGTVRHHRYTGAPLEPRAYLASYDPQREHLTFWATTQCPHPMRLFLSRALGIEENDIRVVQPNVGGAFGLKIPFFQEEPLIAYLSKRLGRPVRWVAERSEDLLAGGHARETVFHWSAGYRADGEVTALRASHRTMTRASCLVKAQGEGDAVPL